MLDEAKAEEEEAFLEAMDAAATTARSPEALEGAQGCGEHRCSCSESSYQRQQRHPV